MPRSTNRTCGKKLGSLVIRGSGGTSSSSIVITSMGLFCGRVEVLGLFGLGITGARLLDKPFDVFGTDGSNSARFTIKLSGASGSGACAGDEDGGSEEGPVATMGSGT